MFPGSFWIISYVYNNNCRLWHLLFFHSLGYIPLLCFSAYAAYNADILYVVDWMFNQTVFSMGNSLYKNTADATLVIKTLNISLKWEIAA